MCFADGNSLQIKGSAYVTIKICNVTQTGTVYFIENVPFKGILGMDVMSELDICIRTKRREIILHQDSENQSKINVALMELKF